MSDLGSPFLKQDTKQDWRSWIAWDDWRKARTYRERIIPSEYSQRLKIEKYRYRWYQRNGLLGRPLLALANSRAWWFLMALCGFYLLRVIYRLTA